MKDYEKGKTITQEEAMNLLFSVDKNKERKDFRMFIDQYGNYYYPTDFETNTPNTAYGSSGGFGFLSVVDVALCK